MQNSHMKEAVAKNAAMKTPAAAAGLLKKLEMFQKRVFMAIVQLTEH
jgi:hypothetical protein